MSASLHQGLLQAGAGSLNFVRSGSAGVPVVFLHGVTRCWQTFTPLLAGLSVGRQLFGLDFRGHGKSERRPGAYQVTEYVEDVFSLLRHIGIPAVLYGHSLGAMVAAAAAAELPGLIRGVILEDPPFESMGSRIREGSLYSYFSGVQQFAGSKDPVGVLARRLGQMELIDEQTGHRFLVRDVRDPISLRFTAMCLKHLDPDALDPIVRCDWLKGYDRHSIYRRVQCPVLLLQGDPAAGGMLTDADAAEAVEMLADCTHLRFPGGPHLLHWARTQEVMNAVNAFIETLAEVGPVSPQRTRMKEELRI